MKHLRSIELAIELATRQRDAQANHYAQSLRDLESAHQQMTQLQGYAGEIDARWGHAHAGALTAELVHHHYQFSDRLQHAVTLQMGNIVNLQSQRDAAHKVLLEAEFRLSGLRQVLAQRRHAEQQLLQRREQRAMDEFATQKYARQIAERQNGEHS